MKKFKLKLINFVFLFIIIFFAFSSTTFAAPIYFSAGTYKVKFCNLNRENINYIEARAPIPQMYMNEFTGIEHKDFEWLDIDNTGDLQPYFILDDVSDLYMLDGTYYMYIYNTNQKFIHEAYFCGEIFLKIILNDGSILYSEQFRYDRVLDEFSSDEEYDNAKNLKDKIAEFVCDFDETQHFVKVTFEKLLSFEEDNQNKFNIWFILPLIIGTIVIILLCIIFYKKIKLSKRIQILIYIFIFIISIGISIFIFYKNRVIIINNHYKIDPLYSYNDYAKNPIEEIKNTDSISINLPKDSDLPKDYKQLEEYVNPPEDLQEAFTYYGNGKIELEYELQDSSEKQNTNIFSVIEFNSIIGMEDYLIWRKNNYLDLEGNATEITERDNIRQFFYEDITLTKDGNSTSCYMAFDVKIRETNIVDAVALLYYPYMPKEYINLGIRKQFKNEDEAIAVSNAFITKIKKDFYDNETGINNMNQKVLYGAAEKIKFDEYQYKIDISESCVDIDKINIGMDTKTLTKNSDMISYKTGENALYSYKKDKAKVGVIEFEKIGNSKVISVFEDAHNKNIKEHQNVEVLSQKLGVTYDKNNQKLYKAVYAELFSYTNTLKCTAYYIYEGDDNLYVLDYIIKLDNVDSIKKELNKFISFSETVYHK